jgi:hypothetical protein
MGDPAANGAEPSPESRLLAAGFTRRLEFWCPPGEERVLNLNDAIAALDAGEVQPDRVSWPGVHPGAVVGLQAPSEDKLDRILRPPPPSEPPPLPGWAEPWAELLAEKLKRIVGAEVRAALKAEARRAREPQA